MDWNKLFDWLGDRLSENSTWRGIIALLTAFGMTIDPENALKIVAGGISIGGLINILRKAPPTGSEVANAIKTGDTTLLVNPTPPTTPP